MEKIEDKIYKNRWRILFITVITPFMDCLDISIVNVALPIMAQKLSVSMATIEWVVITYSLAIVSTLLVFGRFGDIKGKTKIFKFGLILFILGSLMCGISRSLSLLLVSRVIQGIGASASMATNMGILTQVFPSNERGRALGISASFVALGTMVGPPIGGFIVSYFTWQYIFLINVPIVFVIILFAVKILPNENEIINERFDILGSVLFALSIILLFGCLIRGQKIGYNQSMIIIGIILSIIFFIVFIIVEKEIKNAVLELSIFKNRIFSISIACAFFSFVSIGSINIILPFYLQKAVKLSPGITGLIMMVSPVIILLTAPISGYISDRIGSEFLTFVGLILISLGLLLMCTIDQYTIVFYLIIFIGIMSIGNGLFQSPNNSLIMSTVPNNKLGIAGGVNALIRNLGTVFGITISTTLLYNRMSYKIGYHVDDYINGRDDIFIYGMKYVFVAAAALCLIGVVITALRLFMNNNKYKYKETNL